MTIAGISVSTYSFCERVWAGPSSPWHIRRLSSAGRKLGGGIDTRSLCGRIVPPEGKGWDLDVEITSHHLTHSCKACVAEYERITKSEISMRKP